jgi:hypothetical protein
MINKESIGFPEYHPDLRFISPEVIDKKLLEVVLFLKYSQSTAHEVSEESKDGSKYSHLVLFRTQQSIIVSGLTLQPQCSINGFSGTDGSERDGRREERREGRREDTGCTASIILSRSSVRKLLVATLCGNVVWLVIFVFLSISVGKTADAETLGVFVFGRISVGTHCDRV